MLIVLLWALLISAATAFLFSFFVADRRFVGAVAFIVFVLVFLYELGQLGPVR